MRIHQPASVPEVGQAILFVSSPSALVAPSGGGSPMITLSLLKSFRQFGWRTGLVGFVKEERWPGDKQVSDRLEANDVAEQGSFWFGIRKDVPTNATELALIVDVFKPQLIYSYGYESAALVNRLNGNFIKIVTLHDPRHFGVYYKVVNSFRNPSFRQLYRAVRRVPAIFEKWKCHRREELPELSKSDIVIVHSFKHSVFYQSRLPRPVSYFPNPLSPVSPLKKAHSHDPPAFIMAGGLNSSVSVTGLEFFLRKVLPHLRRELDSDQFQIRIMGGGNLRPYLEPLLHIRNIKLLGNVSHEMLLDEYSRAVALLVPAPLPLGFRTRIMDAFRFGVPVIAHPANQAGFKELSHNDNCLMSSDGYAFAQLMAQTRTDQNLCARLAARAKSEFLSSYSSNVYAEFVIQKAKEIAQKRGLKCSIVN